MLFVLTVLGVSIGSLLDLFAGQRFPDYLYPRTSAVFASLTGNWSEWLNAFLFTSGLSLVAGVIATVLGLILGMASSYLRLWSLEWYMRLIWSMPLVAISVYLALVIGLGWAFGLTLAVFLGFYPVAKHAFDVSSRPHEGILALRAGFSFTKYQEYRYLRLPLVLSGLGTALGSALPLCVIGETMAEYTIGNISPFSPGLGGMLLLGKSQVNYPKMWCAMILMMAVVFFSGFLIEFLWRQIVPYKDEEVLH